ncbi:kinase [Trichoderma arundinaceum]|uniref:Very-long-chain (3R)-3-hydroxyacyl-CoA dehydratase n=1 Tax=Trichoderma arundinaceum TaxID=490622 RepID=A0A395NPR9_TRIAR|nr:kinase [Trichoderma arundinaceum]
MIWRSDEKTGSHTADSEVHSYSEDIEAFFTRNGFDGRTRDACDEYARVRFSRLEARPSPTQGYCSYTLNMSNGYLLQFRPEAFMLDIDTCSEVKAIYGKFAPTTTYLGKVQGILLESQDANGGSSSSVMHAYLHERIQGIPLSEFRRRTKGCETNNKLFKRRLMSGLAKVFALGFRGRQISADVAILAGSMAKGRIGESMRWRLDLLNGLPGQDLLRHVSGAQSSLDSVEASDWCLTHGDLLPGNIMVDAKTGRLTGLIDWAEAEWLPFGMALYGIEEVLGEDVESEGFRYYEDHTELRRLFWKKFLALTRGNWSPSLINRRRRVEASRTLGILLWRGIAFDDGRIDRVVETGRDDSEIQKLRLFLDAPGVLDITTVSFLSHPLTLVLPITPFSNHPNSPLRGIDSPVMAPSKKSAVQKPPSSPVKNGYLILCNAVSAAAWGLVLQGTVTTLVNSGPQNVFVTTGEWTKWTQTAAAMEILHSLFGKKPFNPPNSLPNKSPSPPFLTSVNKPPGVVRAPLFTTLMQVASRFLLVWGVLFLYPYLAVQSPTYSSMLIAWSVTEVIRYSYFALSLSGWTPKPLTWLRYNTFFILYPIGILSECSLIYLAAVGPATTATEYPLTLMPYVFYGILAIYVPGSYVLYTHMMAQRRKVLRSLKAKDEKATQ